MGIINEMIEKKKKIFLRNELIKSKVRLKGNFLILYANLMIKVCKF